MTSSTTSPPIITTDLVLLDTAVEGDKQAVIARLVDSLAAAGRTSDADGLVGAAMAREQQSATGLPGGIAIPHCRSPYVDTPTIGFARLRPAVDFGAPDGPADLAFLIAAPDSGGQEHMKLLSSLARALVRKDFVEALRNASTAEEVVGLVDGVVNPAPATDKAAEKVAAKPTEKPAEKSVGQDAHRDHRLPHRHRAHLHGRRRAGRRGQGGRGDDGRGDPGFVGQHPGAGRDHRRGRRGHLRHRRRRQGPGPVRRQARDRLRREAGDQRARQDGRRSRCRRGQSERATGGGLSVGAPAQAQRRPAESAGAPARGRSC